VTIVRVGLDERHLAPPAWAVVSESRRTLLGTPCALWLGAETEGGAGTGTGCRGQAKRSSRVQFRGAHR
jgi:hypothetical protein